MVKMDKFVKKILVTEKQIQKRVKELAHEIKTAYTGKDFIIIGVLKGCLPFLIDLTRELPYSVKYFFVEITSFEGGVKSTGKLTVKKGVDIDIKGKNILIVEDIIDSGLTLSYLKKHLENHGAFVKVVTLLDKKEARKIKIEPDFTGFVIPKEFVIGYGLDYEDGFRNLSYIGVMDLDYLEKHKDKL